MNFLKILRKPFSSILLSTLMIFVSCEKNNLNIEFNENEISLHPFEKLKGQLIAINQLNLKDSKIEFNSRLDLNNFLLSEINNYYDTDIDFDDKLKSLSSAEEIFNWIKANTLFNQNDVDNLKIFSSNLTTLDFDQAVSILDNNITDLKDSNKFEKYQSIVNAVAIIEYEYPGYFTTENYQGIASKGGCAFALFKLGLASAALVGACSPPAVGASVGWTCYLAATAFIAASASVGIECGEN